MTTYTLKENVLTDNLLIIPTSIKNQIIESINMGYNQIQIGYISKKTKGIALTNNKYQVRGTYPIELKEIIEKLILNSFGDVTDLE